MITLAWISGVLLILSLTLALADTIGEPLPRRYLMLGWLAAALGLDGLTFIFCLYVVRIFT